MLKVVSQESFLITILKILSEGFDQSKFLDAVLWFFLKSNESLNTVIEIEENFVGDLVFLSSSELCLKQIQDSGNIDNNDVLNGIIELLFKLLLEVIFFCGCFILNLSLIEIILHKQRQLLQRLNNVVNLHRGQTPLNCLVSVQE